MKKDTLTWQEGLALVCAVGIAAFTIQAVINFTFSPPGEYIETPCTDMYNRKIGDIPVRCADFFGLKQN